MNRGLYARPGRLGHGHGRREGEAVGLADDEVLEGVEGIDRPGGGRSLAARGPGSASGAGPSSTGDGARVGQGPSSGGMARRCASVPAWTSTTSSRGSPWTSHDDVGDHGAEAAVDAVGDHPAGHRDDEPVLVDRHGADPLEGGLPHPVGDLLPEEVAAHAPEKLSVAHDSGVPHFLLVHTGIHILWTTTGGPAPAGRRHRESDTHRSDGKEGTVPPPSRGRRKAVAGPALVLPVAVAALYRGLGPVRSRGGRARPGPVGPGAVAPVVGLDPTASAPGGSGGEEAAVTVEESSEAHLPAQRPPALQAPRLPQEDVDPRRTRGDPQPAHQGSSPPVRLIAPLRDRRTLRIVRDQGRRGRSGPVTVRHAPGPRTGTECLVAFAIGRRTGTAVVRNRIRRRLRAALTELSRRGTVPAGAVVVTAGPSVASAPFAEVEAHLARALARASSLLRPRSRRRDQRRCPCRSGAPRSGGPAPAGCDPRLPGGPRRSPLALSVPPLVLGLRGRGDRASTVPAGGPGWPSAAWGAAGPSAARGGTLSPTPVSDRMT